ncbi:Cytochrome P450 9e2 [Harpegnathos saltator]|uniref:Cytochrome P450 9e2 n=1 Tax=Harpegnathos saltator TaxID=610380 RepID=E2BX75_HARSA|nr:Cytochrome P450 9e2 [Harpegnathos saltator]
MLWLAGLLKPKVISEKIANFLRDAVETIIRIKIQKGIIRSDMLQLMMESKDKKGDNKELTVEDMAALTFTFFSAGYETSSTLMCFASHWIGRNEKVQNRLQDEIDRVLEDRANRRMKRSTTWNIWMLY